MDREDMLEEIKYFFLRLAEYLSVDSNSIENISIKQNKDGSYEMETSVIISKGF